MSGFKAEAQEIRSAGKEMAAAAAEVKSADPSATLSDIGTALPGSRSAAAAAKLATAWEKRFKDWNEDGVGQAERLRTAADRYDESDHRASENMRMLMRRTGEMR